MARPHEQSPAPDQDVWSNTWGDPALQALGRYLVAHGLTEEQAALTVEQIWLFYSYEALPILDDSLPMGITARRADSGLEIQLWLPTGVPDLISEVAQDHIDPRSLHQRFVQDLAGPLAEHVPLRLGLKELPVSERRGNFSVRRSFRPMVRRYATEADLDFVGVFVDDLAAELGTVMDPDLVGLWLDAPNSLFGGDRPAAYLRGPHNRLLRDVITRAKFNLLGA